MGLYRHPHLVRGTVHTPKGAFVILRGIVDVPDDIGEHYGWEPVGGDETLTPRVARNRVAENRAVDQPAVRQ
jgi:hypothetical protein